MQEYLLALLIDLEAKKETVEKQIAKIIGEFEGKILDSEIKSQELAQPIKKQKEVNLYKIFLTLEPGKVFDLEKELRHEAEIIRFILVKFPYAKVKKVKEDDIAKIARKNKGESKVKTTKIKIVKKIVKKTASKKAKDESELDKALEKILKE